MSSIDNVVNITNSIREHFKVVVPPHTMLKVIIKHVYFRIQEVDHLVKRYVLLIRFKHFVNYNWVLLQVIVLLKGFKAISWLNVLKE